MKRLCLAQRKPGRKHLSAFWRTCVTEGWSVETGKTGFVLGALASVLLLTGVPSSAGQGSRVTISGGRSPHHPRAHTGHRFGHRTYRHHGRSGHHDSFHYDRLGPSIDRLGPSIDRLGPGIRFHLGGHRGWRDHGSSGHIFRYYNRRHGHTHVHNPSCGHPYLYPYPSHDYLYPHHYPPHQVTVVVPPPVYVTTPYYCEPCGVGYAGVSLFHRHLERVHDIGAGEIEASLVDVQGRVVFSGY